MEHIDFRANAYGVNGAVCVRIVTIIPYFANSYDTLTLYQMKGDNHVKNHPIRSRQDHTRLPFAPFLTADTCQCLTGNLTDNLNTVILCQPLRRGDHLGDCRGGFARSVKLGDIIRQ